MPHKAITQQMLDQALATLKEELRLEFATKQDLFELEERLNSKFFGVFSLIDRYMKRTND